MNDWPADPKLDESLRRLVESELAAARADGAGLSMNRTRPSASRTSGPTLPIGLPAGTNRPAPAGNASDGEGETGSTG